MRGLTWLVAIACLALVSSCHDGGSTGDDDGSSDSDSDTDTDTDVDSDSDSDGDTDTDTDADSDGDTDGDTDSDSDTGIGDPLCAVELGGACTPLVAGCAACGEGALVNDVIADCESDEWCCVPYSEPGNDCENIGGVCAPAGEESNCPTGWGPVWTSCGGDSTMCCMPSDACV